MHQTDERRFNTSAVRTTVAYSPARFARLMACTSAAVRHVPSQSLRPNVKPRVIHHERLEPEVACHPRRSFHRIVGNHAREDQSSTPAPARSRDSRSVPMKALLVRLATTEFLGCGIASPAEFVPGLPRGDSGIAAPWNRAARDRWRRPLAEQAASSAAIFHSACGLLRSPQLGWSMACCTSITSSAAALEGSIQRSPPRPPRRPGFFVGSSAVNVSVTSAVCFCASTFRSALVAPRPSKSASSLIRLRK